MIFILSACTITVPKKKALTLGPAPNQPERTPMYKLDQWTIARASLHNHTIYSDGKRTPEDLLKLAQQQGMAILAYTDHREGKVCADKFCVQAGGVEKVGYAAYFDRIREMQTQAKEQGMIAIKGVEVSSPWFVNDGKVPNLVLYGQYNHFVVYGIDDPKILDNMPARREFKLKPEGIPDDRPYQEFVDYIVGHGGIVSAAHVEEEQNEWMGPVHAVTPSPIYNLHLKHLTDFAIFPSGWHKKAGGAGGMWDTVLAEYQAGMREKPLWAIGDSDYHGPDGSLATSTTLFYMKEFNEDEIFRCMREGRMVPLQGQSFQNSYVSEWWVSDSGKPSEKIMLGQTAVLKGTPVVRFSLDHPVSNTTTRLIRNGVVVAENSGSEITFEDKNTGEIKEPVFYRIEVTGPQGEGDPYKPETSPYNELIANPVFVKFAR